jgi:hypothetical protein
LGYISWSIKTDYDGLTEQIQEKLDKVQRAYSEQADIIDVNLQIPTGNESAKSASDDYYAGTDS